MLKHIGDGPFAYRVGQAMFHFPSRTRAARHFARGARAWARAVGCRPPTPREARLAARRC